MENISFFTPVVFNNEIQISRSERDLENIDSYFYLGGKKACVFEKRLNNYSAVLSIEHAPIILTALKILSFLTVILPLIMLTAKAIVRAKNKITVRISNTIQSGKDSLRGTESGTEAQLKISSGDSLIKIMTSIVNDENAEKRGDAVVQPSEVQPSEPRKKFKIRIVKARALWTDKIKQELARNINITPVIINKIKQVLPEICKRKNIADVEWIGSRSHGVSNLVFSLPKLAPELVFKIGNPGNQMSDKSIAEANEQIVTRYNNVIRAKKVCLINKLDCLKIPNATKIEVKSVEGDVFQVFAEERLKLISNTAFPATKNFNNAIRQLAIFITKTGFSDVVGRNVPQIDMEKSNNNEPHIGLIDLEEMEMDEDNTGPTLGIYGMGNYRTGLIRLLTETEQIEIVKKIASENGIVDPLK